MREYHFYKMDLEARRALAEPPESDTPTQEQEITRQAMRVFLADYNLPEMQMRVPADAAQEFLEDHKKGRVPRWALRAVKLRELRAAARG